MKVYMCVLVVVAAAASAVSTSQQQQQQQASQPAQASSTVQTSSSSSSSSQGTPSQVANKRGDGDFATSASQQQPVYSPSHSQQASSHSQSGSGSGFPAAASNEQLYYYYYPAHQAGAGKSESAGADPYQTSAASSYPTYASDGPSHSSQHSGYDSSGPSYGSYASQSQLHQAYAQSAHAGSPPYSYGGPLLPSDSQISAQYSSGSGAPVTAYQSQPSYPSQGNYQAAPSNYQGTYAQPAGDGKSRLYGLGSVIMPLVGLGALAFLLPSVTNLGGKKKTKRSVDNVEPNKANSVAEYAERLEKYFKIYRAAVESEDCMNRIFCEVGDAVSTVRGKAALLALFEKVAPQWMTGKMGVFKFGALSDKSAKCARYKCA